MVDINGALLVRAIEEYLHIWNLMEGIVLHQGVRTNTYGKYQVLGSIQVSWPTMYSLLAQLGLHHGSGCGSIGCHYVASSSYGSQSLIIVGWQTD